VNAGEWLFLGIRFAEHLFMETHLCCDNKAAMRHLAIALSRIFELSTRLRGFDENDVNAKSALYREFEQAKDDCQKWYQAWQQARLSS
jgi:hypothetical protein